MTRWRKPQEPPNNSWQPADILFVVRGLRAAERGTSQKRSWRVLPKATTAPASSSFQLVVVARTCNAPSLRKKVQKVDFLCFSLIIDLG